jgi:hypothetical protein
MAAFAGPMVRIRLPAESLSLAPSRSRTWRTPAFRAGVRGWLGDRVGRDAQVGPTIAETLTAREPLAAVTGRRTGSVRNAVSGAGSSRNQEAPNREGPDWPAPVREPESRGFPRP